MKTMQTDPTWWRKNLEMALADDGTQPIEDFNIVRAHLVSGIMEDAVSDPHFDLNSARKTLAVLYSRAPSDHRAALQRLMKVRECVGGNCARL